MEPAVAIAGVTKDFPLQLGRTRLRALDDVSFSVAPGEVVGLLGANGSGKSTLLKVLLGLLAPSPGEVRLFGVSCHLPRARERVGFLAESADFPRFLTARELVVQAGRLCGMNGEAAAVRAAELLAWAGLAADADRRLGTFSKGMRQRAGLAQALVHDPALVILDEPTTGLDPVGVAEFGALVRDLKARGTTVLLCSQHLAQVEELCDRVIVLNRGRVVAEEAVAELRGPRRLDAFPAGGALERRFLALVQSAAASDASNLARRVSAGIPAPRSSGHAETGSGAPTLPRTSSTDAPAAAASPAERSVPALTRRATGTPSSRARTGDSPVARRVSGGTAALPAWRSSFRRIRLLAALTLRDAIRQRTPYVVLLLALALVASAQVLRGFNFGGSELKFLAELGLGAVSLAGSVVAVIAMTQLFSGELERGGATWLLAKPVRRAEFVVGRLLGTWVALACFVGVLVVLVGVQLAARAYELEVSAVPLVPSLVSAAVALTLKLGVVAALTLMVGTWVRTPLLALFAALLVVLGCHLLPFAHHASQHAMVVPMGIASEVLALALPDLSLFDRDLSAVAARPLAPVAGYALVYMTLFVGLAGVAFRRREL